MAQIQTTENPTTQGPCLRCGLRHPQPWTHKDECTRCYERTVVMDHGKPTLWCGPCTAEVDRERSMPDIDAEDDDEAFFTSLRGGNALLGKGVS